MKVFKLPELLLLLCSAYYLIAWPLLEVTGWFLDARIMGLMLFFSWGAHVALRTFDLLPAIWRWIQVSATIAILVAINWPRTVTLNLETSIIPGWHIGYSVISIREEAALNLTQWTFWVAAVLLFARRGLRKIIP